MSRAQALLAPYAVPHTGLLGRPHPEPPDATRFPFQRDRDRIIHAQAFRRLKGKTQVFVEGRGDHFRTRLTHTLEVVHISRDIARSLSLNEDLTEAIALAHDLGHPPFGHAGEEALHAWMSAHGGRFEHNEQSERVLTLLEEHATGTPGLNLNREIIEGLHKHAPHSPSLEAQIVDLADEIAYTGHDSEDGMRAGLFDERAITQTALGAQARRLVAPRGTSLRGGLISILITDLLDTTQQRLLDLDVTSVDDVRSIPERIASFSHETGLKLKELRTFLWERMYLHPDVCARAQEGQEIIHRLCTAYATTPPEKVISLQRRTGSALPHAVKDYVAGMTDSYAREQAARL